jgi:hypothetical protein
MFGSGYCLFQIAAPHLVNSRIELLHSGQGVDSAEVPNGRPLLSPSDDPASAVVTGRPREVIQCAGRCPPTSAAVPVVEEAPPPEPDEPPGSSPPLLIIASGARHYAGASPAFRRLWGLR